MEDQIRSTFGVRVGGPHIVTDSKFESDIQKIEREIKKVGICMEDGLNGKHENGHNFFIFHFFDRKVPTIGTVLARRIVFLDAKFVLRKSVTLQLP